MEAVSLFLDNACPDHHVRGGSDHVRAGHTAMRLLARHPEIAAANFYTAVVCGDLDAVNRALAADPGWATRRDGEPGPERTGSGGELDLARKDWGLKGWEPLSYLTFTRLPLPSVTGNAVAIARALLDHAPIPTCISWPAAAATRRSPARSGKAKRAGPRISSVMRWCGSFSSGAPTRTTNRSSTTSISTARSSGFSS